MNKPNEHSEVFIFADESEYKIPWKDANHNRHVSYIYSVGAVAIEGRKLLDGLNDKLNELREEIIHDPSISNHEERERLKSSGWHLTEDQISTSAPLWQFMGQSLGIKYHYRYLESLEKIEGSKLSRVYAVLYASAVKDIVRRYIDNWQIHLTFEQLTDLNSKFERLVEFCVDPIKEFANRPPSVRIVSKGESDLSSVADYMILGTSRLIGQNEVQCEATPKCGGHCREHLFARTGPLLGHVDSANFHFRNFENVRSNLSSAHRIRLHTGVLS